jgi:Uma2 family endonuclease
MVERGAFEHLNRKIELIRGELREMNPAGPLHDGLITYLNNWSVLAASKHDMLVTSQTGLNLRELESQPEPDLLWLVAGDYRKRHPSAADVRLAIEVSDSSLQSDLREKADLYAESGIAEYWIVDANTPCIHVYRTPQGNQYTDRAIVKPPNTISPLAAPDAGLDLSDLFD